MLDVPIPADLETARAEVARLREAKPLAPLAIGLYHLGCKHDERRASAEALDAYREALAIVAELPPSSPPAQYLTIECGWRSGLALTRLERRSEAVRVVRQAVETAHPLASRSPSRFYGYLVKARGALGPCLARLGRPKEALMEADRSVEDRRYQAEKEPGPHARDLADGLASRGWRYAEYARFADAWRDFIEAREFYRRDPGPFLEAALGCSAGLVEVLLRLGKIPAALDEAREAHRLARSPNPGRPQAGAEFQLQAALDHSRAALRAGLTGEAVLVGARVQVLVQELDRGGAPEHLVLLVLASENQARLELAQGRPQAAWLAFRNALVRLAPAHEAHPRAHGPLMAQLIGGAAGVRDRLGPRADPLPRVAIPYPEAEPVFLGLVGSVPGPTIVM